MGFTLDAFGKPVYTSTPTQTVPDLQGGADFARDFAWVREGTRDERLALPSAKTPDGMLFTETDYGWVWLRRGGAWRLLFSEGGKHKVVPAAVSGTNVTVSANGTVQLTGTPGSAAVQILGVFSSLFKHYEVEAVFTAKPSAASTVQGTIGASVVTAATHSRSQSGFVAGARSDSQATAQSNFGEAFLPQAGTAGSATAKILSPNAAEPTFILSQTAHLGGVTGVVNASAALNSSDQLTGLQLNLASGTWTGQISFYGVI